MIAHSESFQFKPSPALQALKAHQFTALDAYKARLNLFNLSVLADYDQLVCLPALTNVDKTLVSN